MLQAIPSALSHQRRRHHAPLVLLCSAGLLCAVPTYAQLNAAGQDATHGARGNLTGQAVSPGDQTVRAFSSQYRIPGEYIVVLKQDALADAQVRGLALDISAAVGLYAEELSVHYGGNIAHLYTHALTGFSTAGLDEKSIRQLAQDPAVAYVEANQTYQLNVTQSPAPWGLDRIDQRNLPLSNSYTYNATGSGINAYVIDTGIRASHNNFGGRVRSGYTAINDGRGTSDCNGHGTHVSGILGSATYGVAKSVNLYPVRVFGCASTTTTAAIIAGVDWVANNRVTPAVANMSLGGPVSSTMDQAVNNLINRNVTVVVAAGNENQSACNRSPARVANAITVGSTTSSDVRSSFSNFGTCLDLFAPGSNITSTWYTSNTATNVLSGTSMASPHVAGAVAMYLQNHGSASPASVTNAVINGTTTNRLSSIGSGSPNRLLHIGFTNTTPPPPADFSVALQCQYVIDTQYICSATPSGGTSPYSYAWQGAISDPTQSYALYLSCPSGFTANVTVTDANGATGSAQGSYPCVTNPPVP